MGYLALVPSLTYAEQEIWKQVFQLLKKKTYSNAINKEAFTEHIEVSISAISCVMSDTVSLTWVKPLIL